MVAHPIFPIVADCIHDVQRAYLNRTSTQRRAAMRRAIAAWHTMTAPAKDQLVVELRRLDEDLLLRFFRRLNQES